MRTIIFAVFVGATVVCGGAIVLLLAWLLSLALVWLLGLDPTSSVALSVAALGIVAIFFHALATNEALSWPLKLAKESTWTDGPVIDGSVEKDASEESDDREQGNWFQPCACGSGNAFARCCGKRAFKRQRQ